MKNFSKKAFTLVELLIVIGIIGVLSTTLFLTLNPQEAQRKTRDQKRIKDLTDIQVAIEGIMGDGISLPTTNVYTSSAGTTACGSNWTTINVCSYLKVVPLDPRNNVSTLVITDTGTGSVTTLYRLRTNGGQYKLSTRLESVGNRARMTSDGGTHTRSVNYYEVFNDAGLDPQ